MEEWVICPLCWFQVNTRIALKMHFRKVHEIPNSKKFHCHVCSTTFHRFKNLKAHYYRHPGVSSSQKEENKNDNSESNSNTSSESVGDNINQELEDNEWLENFNCNFIKLENKSNESQVDYSQAKLVPKPSPIRPWWIKSYNNSPPVILKKLELPQSVQEKRYECKKCNKIYSQRNKAFSHYRACYTAPSIRCNICQLLTHSLYEMKRHKLKIHNIPTLLCCLCAMEFPTIHLLIQHLNENHKFDHSLLCKLCGKIFKNKRGISAHMKLHDKKSNVKFYCNRCRKTFANRSSLNNHNKKHLDVV